MSTAGLNCRVKLFRHSPGISRQIPSAKVKSKKNEKVPCRLRIMAWLGLATDQKDFKLDTCGQTAVFANTVSLSSNTVAEATSRLIQICAFYTNYLRSSFAKKCVV